MTPRTSPRARRCRRAARRRPGPRGGRPSSRRRSRRTAPAGRPPTARGPPRAARASRGPAARARRRAGRRSDGPRACPPPRGGDSRLPPAASRPRAAPSPSIRTRPTRCAAGAQTRKRTDPSGDPTAPHRRAGPPCLVSFIRTCTSPLPIPGPPARRIPREVPARRRSDGRPPSAVAPSFHSAGERLLARRVRPLVATGVALVGRGPPGPRRVLGEVPRVARPRAGGMAAAGQKTAFRRRPPHVTHWLVSVVRGFFMAGPPFSRGRRGARGEDRRPDPGAAARPAAVALPDRRFPSLNLRP